MPRSGGGDPLDARQGNVNAGSAAAAAAAVLHRSSSAPGGGGHGHAGDGGSSRHAASEGGASDYIDRAAAEGDERGAGPGIPERPATIGRPTFRDCAINAVAVVPLLLGGGGTGTSGGAFIANPVGLGGGGSHSLESFASLLDSLRHFAKSSASGDEPEMSHGMRMRAEAGGAGA